MTFNNRFISKPAFLRNWWFLCSWFWTTVLYAEPQGAASQSAGHDSLTSYSSTFLSEVSLFLRFIFALAIVIILLILTLWLLRSVMRYRMTDGGLGSIDVLAIRYIEPKKAIALVRVLDRVLIIGLAENSLTVLGELTPEEAGRLSLDKKADPGVFKAVLSRLFDKKSGDG